MNDRTPVQILQGLTAVEIRMEEVQHAIDALNGNVFSSVYISSEAWGGRSIALSDPIVVQALESQLTHLAEQRVQLTGEYMRIRDGVTL